MVIIFTVHAWCIGETACMYIMYTGTLHCSLVLKVWRVLSLFACAGEADCAAFHLVIPSKMYAWEVNGSSRVSRHEAG